MYAARLKLAKRVRGRRVEGQEGEGVESAGLLLLGHAMSSEEERSLLVLELRCLAEH